MKMNINRIIRKVLMEGDVTFNTASINYGDQYQILSAGLSKCKGLEEYFPKGGQTRIKPFPRDQAKYFPDLNPPSGDIFYSSIMKTDGNAEGKIYIFGLPHKAAERGRSQSFKAYETSFVDNAFVTKAIPGGWGSGCEHFKGLSELGVDPDLSEDQKIDLDQYLKDNGDIASIKKPSTGGGWTKKPYAELKNKRGQLVLPGYNGSGFIWVKADMENTSSKGVVLNLEDELKKQGFTLDYPGTGTEGKLGFPFGVIKDDFAEISEIKGMSGDTIIYPTSELIITPTKESCKTIIKKLSKCTKTSSPVGCDDDLIRNKFTAIQCGDQAEKFMGGPFGIGLKDEWNGLKNSEHSYGLSRLLLNRRLGNTPTTIRESIKNRVFNILSEEIRKKNR